MFFGREYWTGLHEMAMAAFESQYIDKDTYSASAKDIEVQSCFLDDQLTNLSPPRNFMNKVGSIEPFENPLDTRKLESSSYHALGACLRRPYTHSCRRCSDSWIITAVVKWKTSVTTGEDPID
ncbi:hypothetical protein Tco_0474679 [Tanacetum coccineum]